MVSLFVRVVNRTGAGPVITGTALGYCRDIRVEGGGAEAICEL